MKTRYALAVLVLVVLMQACKTTQKTFQTDFFLSKDLVIDEDYIPPEVPETVYEIYEVSIRDSLLTLYVKYYSGDEIQNFELITPGLQVKTLPPVVPLYLRGVSPVGVARKLIFQELIFNVSALKQYADTQLVLKIHGYPSVVNYKY